MLGSAQSSLHYIGREKQSYLFPNKTLERTPMGAFRGFRALTRVDAINFKEKYYIAFQALVLIPDFGKNTSSSLLLKNKKNL